MRIVLASLLALFLSMGPVAAQLSLDTNPSASQGAQEPKVKAQLIAENDAIAPGQKFRVALRQEITPGWHTYWRNPGDTGLATTIDWQLPQGFAAGELEFPTPHKEPASGLMNFGYEGDVAIIAEITPPADLKIGEDIELKGKANWLVCQEVCIPESASFLLTLPVKVDPAPGPWASVFIATDKKRPQQNPAQQTAALVGDNLVITVDPLPLPANELPEEAFFFPHDGLLIQHGAEQKLELNGRRATLTIPRNTTRSAPVTSVTGDLWFRNAMGERSFEFKADVAQQAAPAVKKNDAVIPAPDAAAAPNMPPTKPIGFFSALLAAFLGGLILNLMPCVFPVLSLKALGLVHKSQVEDRNHIIAGGLVYTAGVMASFIALGLVLAALKAAGHGVGWGAQLQSPRFVAALALLLFFIGISLSGMVSLGARLIGVGQSLTHKHGWTGNFFTGALAVIVATPCTAPFMGGAVFYALTQPASVTLAVMMTMGLGLAFPYLFLCLVPNALRFLPRPGVWMEYFKQFLAFPMLAASVWLVWVIAQQTGANGVLFVLGSMLILAFGFWLWHTTDDRLQTTWQIFKKIIAVIAVLFSFVLVAAQPSAGVAMAQTAAQKTESFERFSGARLSELRSQNKAVFVDMTAAWCITCLANDKAALGTKMVTDFFLANDITFLKGDWTNYDDEITQYLKNFGRSGVPIYVFYPADQTQQAVVLPQLLTSDIIINTIQPLLGETK